MIAIVFLSFLTGIIGITGFVIIYYAIKTSRQGFKIFWQKLEYFSSIVSIEKDNKTFHPRGRDATDGLLPCVVLIGRDGSILIGGPPYQENGIITREIVSKNGSFAITKKDETCYELIKNFLSISGVESIYLGKDFISVYKLD